MVESQDKGPEVKGVPPEGALPPQDVTQTNSPLDIGPELRGDSLPLIGIDSIEGYEILGRISQGGQAVVYKAVQKAARRTVALKVLHRDREASPRDRQRFEREVGLVASLEHPGIVTLYDSGVTKGHYYFAMAYVRGRPFNVYLADHRLNTTEILQLFRKICDAVGYAHRCGVVHRDLKPGNVLVDADGEPRVLDFGLARAAGRALLGEAPPLTQTGEFMGTLTYASPEQFAGDPRRIDFRTDVYSLGVMLYEAFTGSKPHPPMGDITAMIHAVTENDPPRPSAVRPDIDREIETIILACLDKDPQRRYSSAAELSDDIGRYLDGQPIRAKPDSVTYFARKRLRRSVGRHPWTAHVAVCLLAWLVAQYLLTTGTLIRRPDRAFQSAALSILQDASGAGWSDRVIVIGLDDVTHRAVPELASELELSDVSTDNLVSLRRLHGALMHRLARATPRVVVWDIKFATDQPEFDGDLGTGIDALHESGAKVIVGFAQRDSSGGPLISRVVREKADGWGWIHLAHRPDCTYGAWLADDFPPQAPTLSLSLAAYAAFRQSDARPYVDWDGGTLLLSMRYAVPDSGDVRFLRWRPESDCVAVSEVAEGGSWGVTSDTDVSKRRTAIAWTLIPPAAVLARHSVSYRDVLAFDEAALRDRFGGRIVVIGDNRLRETPKPDRTVVDDGSGGRGEFSSYVHATAICNLLNRTSASTPGLYIDALVPAVACVIGVVAGVRFPGGWRRASWWLACLALSALAVAVGLLIAVAMRVIISPASAVAALWLTAAGSAWVARTARARRALSDGRHSVSTSSAA